MIFEWDPFDAPVRHSCMKCLKNHLVSYIHYRKFQLKMGLLTLIQIPCHRVLANEIALNLKYHIGLKHFLI